MNKHETLGDRLSGLKLRLSLGTGARARRRRVDRRWQVAAEISGLEERCLMSRGLHLHRTLKDASQSTIYVADMSGNPSTGPYTLKNVAANPAAVMFMGGTSPNTPGVDWGTVPTKSFTFTNNSNNKQTIYPFLLLSK